LFSVNVAGAVLAPGEFALKPISTTAPGATVLFHDNEVAVTELPVWVQVALQPLATV
jgi:hypothetical protein